MVLMWADPSLIPANPASRLMYDLLHDSANSLGPVTVYSAVALWLVCPVGYLILKWRSKRIDMMFPGEEDEIFLDVYPVYENLDKYLVTGEDSFRWSALRSTVRAVRTVRDWSHAIKLEGVGVSRESLGKMREVLSQRLVPAITSGDHGGLGLAREALERFLGFLLDSSSDDLKSIVRTLQSLGFSANS